MNAMTARALSLAVAVAVWALVSHFAKLPLQLWWVVVGLASGLAAGGGLGGLKKAAAGTTSGVIWAMVAVAVSRALGGSAVLDALVLGAAAFGMVFQARVPMLGYTAGAVAGAAVAWGGGAVTIQGGIRVAAALLIGAGLAYGAEYLAGMMKTKA